jgi:hypothetical protein
MEPHPLDGAWTKLAWAYQHVQRLESEIAGSGFQGQLVTFRQEYEPNAGKITVRISEVPEVRIEWSLIALDAFSNLRSALNYLTWELAKWNLEQTKAGREPDGQTQFPIATSAARFNPRFVVDLDPAHVALIQSLQPYDAAYMAQFAQIIAKGANAEGLAGGHPLEILRRMTNTDKHKVLQAGAVGAPVTEIGHHKAVECDITNANYHLQVTLQPDAVWAVFDIANPGANPHVEVNDRVTTQVAFENGRRIRPTFDAIGQMVTKAIGLFLPVFEPEVKAGRYAPAFRGMAK